MSGEGYQFILPGMEGCFVYAASLVHFLSNYHMDWDRSANTRTR